MPFKVNISTYPLLAGKGYIQVAYDIKNQTNQWIVPKETRCLPQGGPLPVTSRTPASGLINGKLGFNYNPYKWSYWPLLFTGRDPTLFVIFSRRSRELKTRCQSWEFERPMRWMIYFKTSSFISNFKSQYSILQGWNVPTLITLHSAQTFVDGFSFQTP